MREFSTGAVRDDAPGKGRYDLLGLKEAISMVVEGAGRVVRVDVQEIDGQVSVEW